MNKLAWTIAIIVIVIWSLLSLGGYALLNVSAELMTQNTELVSKHPDVTGWLVWGLDLFRDIGVFVVISVWALVSLAIVVTVSLFQRGRKLLGGRS
ncbi:MAG: hypothetical protein H7Y02_06180 [Candidatus Obscuribacterales bacterium]|nr:hypothetical protein [Steroidobacteraceae bacterium]